MVVATTTRPRILPRAGTKVTFVPKQGGNENRMFPACCYQLSPETVFCIVGVMILPFLVPAAQIICNLAGSILKSWWTIVGSGAASVLSTTMEFLKMLAFGFVVAFLGLSLMYYYYINHTDARKKNRGVTPSFGDFCLSIIYTAGFPVPGTVLNFLSDDNGQF